MLADTSPADQLHSASIHLLRGVRRVDAAAGLPPAQLSALSVVVFGGPLSLGALAAAEQVRPPTMTRIVDALERRASSRASRTRRTHARSIAATRRRARLLAEGRRRRRVAGSRSACARSTTASAPRCSAPRRARAAQRRVSVAADVLGDVLGELGELEERLRLPARAVRERDVAGSSRAL